MITWRLLNPFLRLDCAPVLSYRMLRERLHCRVAMRKKCPAATPSASPSHRRSYKRDNLFISESMIVSRKKTPLPEWCIGRGGGGVAMRRPSARRWEEVAPLIEGFRYCLARALGGWVKVSVVGIMNPSRRSPGTARSIFADGRRSSNAERLVSRTRPSARSSVSRPARIGESGGIEADRGGACST
jgi:hypothetical protein